MTTNNLNYTKEVMKRFLKPKHMGEIKNPDAIGKVGNAKCGDIMHVYLKIKDNKLKDVKFKTMGCLPPEEKIVTDKGWIGISSIKKGDKVFNSEGKITSVKKIYKKKFSGKLIKIKPFVSKYNGFYVTPEHPILCIKRNSLKKTRISSKKCNWLRVNEKELILATPIYLDAVFLEVGDYLVFPKNAIVKEDEKFTNELMRLIGYYLSEGYITSNKKYLNFSFHKNEEEYITEVKKLVKLQGVNSSSQRTRENVTELRFYAPLLAKFLLKNCGKYAKEKNLSQKIMNLPFEKQFEMIKTIINGDGNTYKRRPNDSLTYRIDTASEKLAIQIQQILARGDILAPIKRFEKPESNINGRKIIAGIIFDLAFKLDKKHNFVKKQKTYFLVPIGEIESKSYSGRVYNLEVNGGDPSYLVRGFVVHNCVAAIASSDAVCEIAKGKTIEQALKITKKDIIKKLGNLPPVKHHCSILGEEALLSAIKDYKSKQGENKK